MAKKEDASEAAIERLKRDIAADRARLSFALQNVDSEGAEREGGIGRLYKVFAATGQAQ
jgi:hypothetical protein